VPLLRFQRDDFKYQWRSGVSDLKIFLERVFLGFAFIITSGYLCLGKEATLSEMLFSSSEATVQYEKEKAGEDGEPCGRIISTFSKINLERGKIGQLNTFVLSEQLENVSLLEKICQPKISNMIK